VPGWKFENDAKLLLRILATLTHGMNFVIPYIKHLFSRWYFGYNPFNRTRIGFVRGLRVKLSTGNFQTVFGP